MNIGCWNINPTAKCIWADDVFFCRISQTSSGHRTFCTVLYTRYKRNIKFTWGFFLQNLPDLFSCQGESRRLYSVYLHTLQKKHKIYIQKAISLKMTKTSKIPICCWNHFILIVPFQFIFLNYRRILYYIIEYCWYQIEFKFVCAFEAKTWFSKKNYKKEEKW